MRCSGDRVWIGWAACGLLAIACALTPAAAQGPSDVGAAPGGEVSIDLSAFGFGGGRPGDWAGLRLTVLDQGERQRTLLVRWHGWDQDGDTPLYERAIASNPGQPLSVWLYGRLPYTFTEDTPIEVSVYEGLDEGASGAGAGYRAGRLLGRTLVSLVTSGARTGRLVAPTSRRYAVVGGSMMGLGRYGTRPSGQGAMSNWSPLAHELTDVAAGLTPQQMPDQWMGLASIDTIVWERGDPADLAGARSRALRRWVERGGHLVVVLPAAGQEWGMGINNPLRDILPRVSVRRLEGVGLDSYRGLITDDRPTTPADRLTPLPARSVVHVFEPLAGAETAEATPLLAGRDGEVVVVRRLVGSGAVTLVGLNLRAPSLASRGLPSTVSFWNRVLGRRGRFLSADELANIDSRPTLELVSDPRQPVYYDNGIGDLVSKTGRAAVGLLAGVGLGAAYVLIAGPVGFALLRRFDRTKHAWVVFVLVAIGFTGAAWGTAAALRPTGVNAKHLTFLDHVYGQPIQRGRTWMGVLLPGYGEATLRVGDPETSRTRAGDRSGAWDLIAPWEPLAVSARGGFPDARGYPVWALAPDTMSIPTRATVKRVQIDWAGGPRWSMPRPVAPDSVRLRPDDEWIERGMLTGALVHDLPAPLRDAVFIVVEGQRAIGQLSGREIVSDARSFSVPEWKPGEAIDLAGLTADSQNLRSQLSAYMGDLTEKPQSGFGLGGGAGRTLQTAPSRMIALALFGQLSPPAPGNAGVDPVVAWRRATHGWDLDRWMTQPCLIVIGRVEAEGEKACPTPVYLGDRDEPIPSDGVTIVRWVYPLAPAPPETPAPVGLESPEDAQAGL